MRVGNRRRAGTVTHVPSAERTILSLYHNIKQACFDCENPAVNPRL
jgi:hypothetical protein